MSEEIGELARRLPSRDRGPVIVGVAGAVAVGKTTIASELAARIAGDGKRVHVVSTDAFLLSNAELAARDILMRKGFPESYDVAMLVQTIASVREGVTTNIPVYSHAIYDLVPGEVDLIEPIDVLIVEGVIALQPAVRNVLDLAIYVDAPEEVVRGWFVDRFVRLTADARDDATSFYHMFATMESVQVRDIAEATWDGINGVNLREHIAPTMDSADVVIEKAPEHIVVAVRSRA
jgi:type I pantothenate kinase